MYLHDCPRQPLIPIFLIVHGVTTIFVLVFGMFFSYRKGEAGLGSLIMVVCSKLLSSVFGCFLFAWFIAGNIWMATSNCLVVSEQFNHYTVSIVRQMCCADFTTVITLLARCVHMYACIGEFLKNLQHAIEHLQSSVVKIVFLIHDLDLILSGKTVQVNTWRMGES